MFAKSLERVMSRLMGNADVSGGLADDMQQRFQTLRDNGRLPGGRENRAVRLEASHVAAAVLGQAAIKPAWAGHGAVVLSHLLAMGGPAEGFCGAPTLAEAVEALVTRPEARNSLVSLRLSLAKEDRGVSGSGVIVADENGIRRFYGYASQLSATTMGPLAIPWDFEVRRATASRDLVLTRRFFDELAREMEATAHWPEPPGDGAEYDADDARRARNARLKVRPSSYFLNLGVDTQAGWPRTETLVPFDRFELVLMPKTAEAQTSIHIDLARFGLSAEAGRTVIRRFLSVRAWEDDQFAVLEDGWAGNSGPHAVSRRDLGFAIAAPGTFARYGPDDDKRRRALAHYRAGCNAATADLVNYAFLSFWKILELQLGENAAIKKWIVDNLPALRAGAPQMEDWEAFDALCGATQPDVYLLRACRVAVAHASVSRPSDEDDSQEIHRIHTATAIIRLLARHLMETEMDMDASLRDPAAS